MKTMAWLLTLLGVFASGCAASAQVHAEEPGGGVLVLKGNREDARRAARVHMTRRCGKEYRVLAERAVDVDGKLAPALVARHPVEASMLGFAAGQEVRLYYACKPAL